MTPVQAGQPDKLQAASRLVRDFLLRAPVRHTPVDVSAPDWWNCATCGVAVRGARCPEGSIGQQELQQGVRLVQLRPVMTA